VDRAEALQALPHTYAIALRLRDEGVKPDSVARVLDVEPEAVGPLLTLAEAKLAGLIEGRGGHGQPKRHEKGIS
jgi:DNA-directed RNA polymerase specialized sigma24 family protein